MLSLSRFCVSVLLSTLIASGSAWADAYLDFFYRQKIGQEITLTGRFSRLDEHFKFFERDYVTGEVEHYDFYGTSVRPTRLVGNGSLNWPNAGFEQILIVYPDQVIVKDLPEKGENLWFTGTLLGFQFGISGITKDIGAGGIPFILLKQVSAKPPSGEASPAPPPPTKVPAPSPTKP